jgi:protocatechuate 3,4-dioxygenase beta subunit
MRALIAAVFLLFVLVGIYFLTTSGGNDGGQAVAPAAPTPAQTESAPPTKLVEPVETARALEVVEADDEADDELINAMLGNSLVGYVYDDEGKPLPNALVKLSKDAFQGEALSMQWFLGKEPKNEFEATRTDKDGKYVFKSLSPRSDYYIQVDHEDYKPSQEDLVFVGEEGEFAGPDVNMVQGASLAGYVFDVGRNPVGDAQLYLDSAYMMGDNQVSPDRMSTTSDSTGYYEFKNVADGPRNLSVIAEGYGMQVRHNFQFKGQPGEKQEHEFQLEPGQPIAGRVFGPEDEPVVGATISAMKYSNQTSSRGSGITNENGEFMINDLSQGSFNLMIDAKGYRVARHNRVQVGDVNVQIEMIKQACVSGRVLDASGKPVKNFTAVVLRSSPQQHNQAPIFENTDVKEKIETSADGSYTLCGLNSGTFVIKVRSKGLAPRLSEPFTVTEGQVVPDVTINLSRGGSIKGRLVDSSGAPVKGAQLSTHDDEHGATNLDPFLGGLVDTSTTQRKGKSDGEGYFELPLLNEGRYKVKVEHPSFTTEMRAGIVVTDAGSVDMGTVTLKAGGVVKGKVFDPSGGLVERGFVRLFRADQNETFSYQTRTDVGGNYVFAHVKPGSYKLSATRRTPSGGGDAFEAILDQQSSVVLINVVDDTTVTRELHLGN